MENHSEENSVNDAEISNMLRAVMLDCASRLEHHADPDDIAEELIQASEKSYDQLVDGNIEIEFDDELLKPKISKPDFSDPILRDLVGAMAAYDEIRAMEIAGYEVKAQSRAALDGKIEALRITLNSKAKEIS